MSEPANEHQVGGDHYRRVPGEQHWDRIWRLYGPDVAYVYFVATITAYVERYRQKNGVEDLKKARHYLDKLIELEEAREQDPRIQLTPQQVREISPIWEGDEVVVNELDPNIKEIG
jgi:hypothetical protein